MIPLFFITWDSSFSGNSVSAGSDSTSSLCKVKEYLWSSWHSGRRSCKWREVACPSFYLHVLRYRVTEFNLRWVAERQITLPLYEFAEQLGISGLGSHYIFIYGKSLFDCKLLLYFSQVLLCQFYFDEQQVIPVLDPSSLLPFPKCPSGRSAVWF